MNNIINKIEENGNLFIDTILKPLAKGSKDILINDSKIAQSFLSLKTAFMENKLSQYLDFIDNTQNEKLIDFIEKLTNEEKNFFIETINKVIDLDDSLQIYIMAYLTKKYKENSELDYYEKQLFYNINTLSEDDFKIFFCMYKENITKNRNSMYVQYAYKNKEIIEISLNKFSNIGLLKIKTNITNDKKDNINSSIRYYTTDYSEPLFQCLNIYFDNKICAKLLEKKENQGIRQISLNFI
jgi:hypothetical protein